MKAFNLARVPAQQGNRARHAMLLAAWLAALRALALIYARDGAT